MDLPDNDPASFSLPLTYKFQIPIPLLATHPKVVYKPPYA